MVVMSLVIMNHMDTCPISDMLGVVYKPFTPPKFELKNIPGTSCSRLSIIINFAADFAVTPSTITVNGDAAASAFHPGLKERYNSYWSCI